MKLNELDVEVIHKNIKHVYLSVYPPDGRVKVSAPVNMAPDTLRVFVVSKLGWIRKQQLKLRAQEREAPPRIEHRHNKLVLSVRPGTNRERKQAIMEAWYRENLRQAVPALIEKWQPRMGVRIGRFHV